jgi:hypothetical protein
MMFDSKKRLCPSWLLGVAHDLQGRGGKMTASAPWSGLRGAQRTLPRPRSLHWLALGFLLLTVSFPALAQGDGVLRGKVVNGTSGGEDVGAGILVTMRSFQNDTPIEEFETVTDAGGGFRFEGLDTDPELQYLPETTYQDVPYTLLEPVQFGGDQTSLDVSITVHETTEDDSAIGLDSVHLIAESFGEVLRITEIHLYGNSGDRTYVGRPSDVAHGLLTTLQIPLPENGVGLALEQSETEQRFIEVEGGVVDTSPVRPGSETSLVFFSYHLMVTGDVVPLERRFSYPVTGMNAMAAQPELSLRSEQLQAMGAETFQGRQYSFYVGDGLAAGAPLDIEFLPAAGESVPSMPASGETPEQAATVEATRGNQGLLRWFGFGLVALAVLGALIYPLATSGQAKAPDDVPGVAQTPASRRLVSELADLEEAFEAGKLDEEDFERQRAEILESLKTLRH